MRPLRSSMRLYGRALAGHLERLRYTLETLGQRLREAVAHAVGQTVADAVREAVHALLTDPPPELVSPLQRFHSPHQRRSLWEDPDNLAPEDDPAELYSHRGGYDEDDYDRPRSDVSLPSPEGPSSRWGRAVAVGCQTTGWWLRRQAGRCSVAVALAVGLASTLTAYAAGTGLMGSAVGLMALAATVGSGATALAWLGAP